MKNLRYALAPLALSIAHCVFPATAQSVEKQNASPSYSFIQNSREASRVIVFATKSAVKLRCIKNHLVILAKAPDWTVYTFCEDSKRICAMPLQSYNNGFRIALAVTGEPTFNPKDFSKVRTDKLLGQSVDWYHTSKEYAAKNLQSHKKSEEAGTYPMVVQFALANSLGYPKEVGWVMERFYGCPKEDGIPIQMDYEACNHGHINKLSTDHITAKTFAANEFEIPKSGYVKVASNNEVFTDGSTYMNASEMMDTFGKFDKQTAP